MTNQKFLHQTTHNISWFVRSNSAGELVLKAPFQRNPVWSDKQKSYLIDTILNGYPIPELYIQEFADEEGKSKCIIVDGQQRLRACFEFINGEFSIDGSDSPDFADLKFDDLTKEQKQTIYNYNFVVRILPEMDDAMLRAMFQRINRNTVALNRQELRHATYWGEFIQLAERLSGLDDWSSLGVFTPNDVRRMLDVEFVSELMVGLLHGLQNKKEQLDDWYKAYEREFPQKSEIESTFIKILAEIPKLLPDIEQTRWKKKSDFYSLFLALGFHAKMLPFARDDRVSIRQKLTQFSSEVDDLIRAGEMSNAHVKTLEYVLAVEKAASDLGSRKARHNVLTDLIEEGLQPALALNPPSAPPNETPQTK